MFDAFGKEGWSFSPFATISYTNFEGIRPAVEHIAGFNTMREETFGGRRQFRSAASLRTSRSVWRSNTTRTYSNSICDHYE